MLCKDIGCAITRIKDLIRQTLWASGAKGVVVGISGGIDSAVAAAIAVKALGPEHVLGVHMPSASSSPLDLADAKDFCDKFGIELMTVPLGDVVSAAFSDPYLTDTPILRGNYTSRLRMATLYNIAAARGFLVCGTSNKTEYMIGYSTKWGDAAADIQPLLHLWKKDVYTTFGKKMYTQWRMSWIFHVQLLRRLRVLGFGKAKVMKTSWVFPIRN